MLVVSTASVIVSQTHPNFRKSIVVFLLIDFKAVEWTLLGTCLALILARLYLRLHLERKCLILSDYFICLAWLCGTWEAAADLELKKLGWLNPSITWLKLESNKSSRLTEKVRLYKQII